MKISICNGRLLDPANNIDKKQDLFIAEGNIVALGKPPSGFIADREINASGCLVCPGVIDLITHLPEPGREHKGTITTETYAAVSGGVTTLCCSPDTLPVLDSPAVAELIHQRATRINLARILPIAAMTKGLDGKTLVDMAAMDKIGCIAVSNANQDMANAEVLRRALEYATSCGLAVHLFCEDRDLKNSGVVHEGPLSTRLGLPAIPSTAETVSVSRALLLAEQTGARLHLSRITSADSVTMIREARDKGLAISADTSIAHLLLNDQVVEGFNAQYHLDPPLRSEVDRLALLEGIREGTLGAICSDHRPHDVDAKSAPFSLSEPGVSTIEHLLALVLKLVDDSALTLSQAIAAVTWYPASILDVDLGRIDLGRPADVCIVSMDSDREINPETMLSYGKNTPFSGWKIGTKVTHTLVNGLLVYTSQTNCY